MKIAVLFHRFGPYHWARLQAASRRCELYGVESSAETSTYDWDRVDKKGDFTHVTVYPDGNLWGLSARDIASRVGGILSDIRPDVVAVPGWSFPDALAATRWCARTSTPSVVMSESTAHDFSRSWWKEAIKRRIVRMHQAGLVGGQLHAAYLTQLGMPRRHVSVGYDVVENQHFREGAARARRREDEVRKELGLPENYYLTSCRFVEKKNLPRLLQAYAMYRRRGSQPWDLVLLGDGSLRGHLLEQAGRHGMADHVHLPGFKQYDELPAYYGLANAFVLASTTEQWGLVVNEAMAAGLPVLVSERCGCAPDLVHEGENGFTFDPYDSVEMARLLVRLDHGGCDHASMGRSSQSIISRWTPERFSKGLLDAARHATSASNRPGTSVSARAIDAGLLWLLERAPAG